MDCPQSKAGNKRHLTSGVSYGAISERRFEFRGCLRGWQHRWNDELWVDFVEFHLADPIRLWIQERFGCTENDASKVRSSSRDNDR